MDHDRIVTFDHVAIVTFFIVAIWHGIRVSWRNRHWYTGRAKHRMSHLGTGRGVWAADLVVLLRAERGAYA